MSCTVKELNEIAEILESLPEEEYYSVTEGMKKKIRKASEKIEDLKAYRRGLKSIRDHNRAYKNQIKMGLVQPR